MNRFDYKYRWMPLLTGLLFLVVGAMFSPGKAVAAEVSQKQLLNLDVDFKDVAISPNGHWIFVLTTGGDLLVYSYDGNLETKLSVGAAIDTVKAGPTDNMVLLSSRQDKRLTEVRLYFVQEIDIQGAPYKGPCDAPVTIVVFSEFQCPYCIKLAPVLKQIEEIYGQNIKVVFKNYPLRTHPYALTAAVAAMAANRQGRFWEYHDLLFEHSKELSNVKIQELAEALGMDMQKFNQDVRDPDILNMIRKDIADGQNAGVRGTPSVYVNGYRLQTRTIEEFKEMIDREMAKAGASPVKQHD